MTKLNQCFFDHRTIVTFKTTIRLLIVGCVFAASACGQTSTPTPVSTPKASASSEAAADKDSIESVLQDLEKVAGSKAIDLSVPFERFLEAPVKLQQIADVIQSGKSGLYVMHYHDDTLTGTAHVFLLSDNDCRYIRLEAPYSGSLTRSEQKIHAATYDEQNKTLSLKTSGDDVALTPLHVTPAGG